MRPRGFTLLELLVVLSIIAIATAGAVLALPDSGRKQLEQEGERLAALLESARTQSRARGVAVRWSATPQGFVFEGLPDADLPTHWLHAGTQPSGPATLSLGPDPLIERQQVVLVNPALPGASVHVATDGLRPFAVQDAP